MNTIRTLAVTCLIVASFALPTHAGELEDAADARAVIQMQLDAFGAKSAEDAYEFAAPNIRSVFPTARVFAMMVKRGYPMVWEHADTEFLDSKKLGEGLVQRLRVIDQKDRAYIAEYLMIQVDGEWRVAGVRIKRDDSIGV